MGDNMDRFFLEFKQQWDDYAGSRDHKLRQAIGFAEAMLACSLDLSKKTRREAYKHVLRQLQNDPRPDHSIYLLGIFLSGFHHFPKDMKKTLKKLSKSKLRRFTQHAAMFYQIAELWGKKDLRNLKKIRGILQSILTQSDENKLQGQLLGLSLITPECADVVQREIIGQYKILVTATKKESVQIAATQALTLASLGSGILEPVLVAQLDLLNSKRRHVRSMASLGLSSIVPWVESTSLRKNVLEAMVNASTMQVVNGVIYSYFNLFFKLYPKNVPPSLLAFLKSSENEIYRDLRDLLASRDEKTSLTDWYDSVFDLNYVDFWKSALLGSFYLEWSNSSDRQLMKEMADFFQKVLESHHMSSVQTLAMNRLVSIMLSTRDPKLVSEQTLQRVKDQLRSKAGSSHSRQDLAMSYVILRSISRDLQGLKTELETMINSLDLSGLTGLLLGLGSALYLHLPYDLPPSSAEDWFKNDEFYFGLLQWMKDSREEALLQLYQAFSQIGLGTRLPDNATKS